MQTDDTSADPFVGDFHRVGNRLYRVLVIPLSLPNWVPPWMQEVVSTFVLLAIFWRRKGPPWKVVLYSRRGRIALRDPVERIQETATLREANTIAKAIDKRLRAGELDGETG